MAGKFIAPASGYITSISWYGRYAYADENLTALHLGVYSDNSGSPGSLLGNGSTSANTTPMWCNVTGLNIPVAGGSTYWLAVHATAGTLRYYYDAGSANQVAYKDNGVTMNFPATFPTPTGYNNSLMSIYANFTPTSAWSNITKTLNATVGKTIGWRVFANDTSNNVNASEVFTLTTTSSGSPDVNITFGPPNTDKLLIDLNSTGYGCGPDDISYWVQPENQTSTLGIFNITNNGTTNAATVQAKLSGSAATGWNVMVSNTSSTPVVGLTTSYQTIWTGTLTPGSKIQVWAFYNCSNITQNPNANIMFQAT